MQKKRHI